MAELEQALQACQREVAGHITQLGRLEAAHCSEVESLRNKVSEPLQSHTLWIHVHYTFIRVLSSAGAINCTCYVLVQQNIIEWRGLCTVTCFS